MFRPFFALPPFPALSAPGNAHRDLRDSTLQTAEASLMVLTLLAPYELKFDTPLANNHLCCLGFTGMGV